VKSGIGISSVVDGKRFAPIRYEIVGLSGDLMVAPGTILVTVASSSRMTRVVAADDVRRARHGYLDAMQPLRRLAARVRALDPYHFDLGLAALAVVGTVAESILLNTQGESRLLTALFGTAMVGPAVALRRRNTTLAAAIAAGVVLVQVPFDTFLTLYTTTPFVVLLLLLYSTGRHLDGRRMWVTLAVLGVGFTLGIELDNWGGGTDLIWVVLLFSPPVLAGRALRKRARLQAELRERAEQAELGREARALQAAEEERNRIAGELQAVVANGVSAMVVQAEAVPRVLAAGDTAAARDTFTAIEATGRDALSEMRRLLGVLRREGEDPALAPQPGLARLEALVERMRETGLAVELEVSGERRDLSTGIDLTAYRVVQEALEAAAAGGAEAAQLSVRYGDRDLELRVRDRGASEPGSGFPLAALRDRVGLYGGFIDASRSDGFAVEVRLPIAAPREPAGSPA
jgi:signal transduction histidine kinase